MLDLEKVGLNRNFPLHLHCPILQNNPAFTMVSKKRDRKNTRKKWGGESCRECTILASLPHHPSPFWQCLPSASVPTLLCTHYQSKIILKSFHFSMYLTWSNVAKCKYVQKYYYTLFSNAKYPKHTRFHEYVTLMLKLLYGLIGFSELV